MSDFTIGLTGGIGSGKSTVARLFSEHGIDIVDADLEAREVVSPEGQALPKLVDHFGVDILLQNGQLDRAKLRERVFSNESEKAWLNGLLHPLIRESMLHKLSQTTSPYAILMVPLLIENKMQSLVDRILVVDLPELVQKQRAVSRDGVSEQQVDSIMQSQASRSVRLACADEIIDNSGTPTELTQQVEQLHQRYLALRHCKP